MTIIALSAAQVGGVDQHQRIDNEYQGWIVLSDLKPENSGVEQAVASSYRLGSSAGSLVDERCFLNYLPFSETGQQAPSFVQVNTLRTFNLKANEVWIGTGSDLQIVFDFPRRP